MSILRSYVVVMPDSGMFIVLNRDMSFVFTYVQAVSQNRTLPGTNRNKGVYSDFFIVGEKYGAVNGPAHDLPEFRPTPAFNLYRKNNFPQNHNKHFQNKLTVEFNVGFKQYYFDGEKRY